MLRWNRFGLPRAFPALQPPLEGGSSSVNLIIGMVGSGGLTDVAVGSGTIVIM